MNLLLRRRKPEPMGIKDPSIIRSQQHLAFTRGFVCSIADKPGHTCSGKTEACHVRTGTDGGTGMKPSDKWVIPICAEGHREQHQIGEAAFEAKYKIDMKAIAQKLWSISKAAKKLERRA